MILRRVFSSIVACIFLIAGVVLLLSPGEFGKVTGEQGMSGGESVESATDVQIDGGGLRQAIDRDLVHRTPVVVAEAGFRGPAAVQDEGVVRQRFARLDTAALRQSIHDLNSGVEPQTIKLDLFDDTSIRIHPVRGEAADADRFVFSGRIENDPHSQVILAERDGFVQGYLSGYWGTYAIEPAGTDGVHRISEKVLEGPRDCMVCEIDPRADVHPVYSTVEPEVQVLTSAATAPSNGSLVKPEFSESELYTIDVLVLYTQAAKFRWAFNLESQVLAKVDAIEEQANDVFARSGTRARVRVVHVAEIELEEDVNQDNNVETIATTESIMAMRDQYAADLIFTLVRNEPAGKDHAVGILTATNIEHGGYGWDAVDNEYYDAWGVAQYNNVLEWLNFVHSIGHLLGCRHDRSVEPDVEGAFDYSFGYQFMVNGEEKITVMSTGSASKLIPYFSNPDLTYEDSGVPMGVPPGQEGQSDCRLTVNRTVFEVSQYRLEPMTGPAQQRLINVSTRGWVGTGGSQMIGGFVLTGSTSQDLIIRAQGPKLADYGVQGVLPDPHITLMMGATQVAANDDWQSNEPAVVQAIQDSGYQPLNEKEPALHVTLAPGVYTCVLGGNGDNATGVGIFELFALQTGEPRVVNLSTRGFVGTGEQNFIAGFVVTGDPDKTRRVVVRVVGPTLTEYGVEGAASDPHLKLYDSNNNLLYVNEDWQINSDYVIGAISDTGYAPADEVEPAMVLDLKPGGYTAIVSPFEDNGTMPESGVGLVEAYEIR